MYDTLEGGQLILLNQPLKRIAFLERSLAPLITDQVSSTVDRPLRKSQ